MSGLTACYDRVIQKKEIGTYLYFSGMIPYTIARAWESTMLPRFIALNKGAMLLFLVAMGLKILLYESFHVKEFLLYAVCLMIGAFSYLRGGSIHLFMTVLLVMGSKEIRLNDILKVYCAISAILLFLAFLGTKFGFFEDISARKTGKIFGVLINDAEAHSYGICNSTDFSARVFFLFLTLLYLKGRGTLLPLCALVSTAVLYWVSRGRIDSGCLLIAAVLWLLDDLIQKKSSHRGRKFWGKTWEILGALAMPLGAALVLGLCWFYYGLSLLAKIDYWAAGRLSSGRRYFDLWNVNLFGREIEMHGWGGHDAEAILTGKEYTFIDISYQQILLINGVLGLLIIIGFYFLLARKNKKDIYLMYVIALVALNCMAAHHLLDFSYIPFIVALTAINERAAQPENNKSVM